MILSSIHKTLDSLMRQRKIGSNTSSQSAVGVEATFQDVVTTLKLKSGSPSLRQQNKEPRSIKKMNRSKSGNVTYILQLTDIHFDKFYKEVSFIQNIFVISIL